MSSTERLLPALLGACLLAACGGGGSGGPSLAGPGQPDAGAGAGTVDTSNDPPLRTAQADLDAALNCTPFENPDKPPVLLIHGTTVTGTEQYTAFYTPKLVSRGFDVCIVTYPDRGLIDQQISAEYVVNALRRIHGETGREVAMIGHSQGASMPRWALRFFPSARDAVADFVLIAGPNHGTTVSLPAALGEQLFDLTGLGSLPIGLVPEAIYQFAPGSDFVAAVNSGDETPGDVDYTSVYTLFDELVQPAAPVPTAALDFDQDNPRVANILLQDVCPGHLAEHFSIGTTDTLTFALALDAISNPGPADVTRAGGASELCGLLPLDLAELAMPQRAADLLTIVASTVGNGPPDPHLAAGEPPLMDYAQAAVD